ncbi:hypothetical protein INT48_005356 [Thamnidium elegans]|uniref:Uncharacterized protein n=1 Tax=Thamnidium elegans TaxID=101142 RepID=A0A8H7VRW7_9FUNG|nr:hypothetical protein INT48_005356 [Thamnidium elegans]
MEILMENEAEYGRRIDLLIKSTNSEEQCDLCSNEFKKSNVTTNIKLHQQSKNMRINACITNDINLLLCTTDTETVYFDFEGRNGYLINLFTYQSCFVAYKVGSFNIPKRLVDLDKFRSSLITLFNWKESTINVSNQVICTLGRMENEYALADVAMDLFEEKPATPPSSTMKFIPVHLSPTSGSKRTRTIFENVNEPN